MPIKIYSNIYSRSDVFALRFFLWNQFVPNLVKMAAPRTRSDFVLPTFFSFGFLPFLYLSGVACIVNTLLYFEMYGRKRQKNLTSVSFMTLMQSWHSWAKSSIADSTSLHRLAAIRASSSMTSSCSISRTTISPFS